MVNVVWRIEIGVTVEPDQRHIGTSETGICTNLGVAVSGEDEWEMTGGYGSRDSVCHPSFDLECPTHLALAFRYVTEIRNMGFNAGVL